MPTKRFSSPMAFTKSNLDKVPADKPGVYRIKDTKDHVLYVGMAKGTRLNDRIAEHKAEHKGEFAGGTKFQYITTPSKEAAERLEKREIRKIKPPRNKVK